MEKIHQLVLSLKWSNGRLKISSAMTLKILMGTFGEHFKFLESQEFSKRNTTFKFCKFDFLKKRKKKQQANIPQSLGDTPPTFHRKWRASRGLWDTCAGGLLARGGIPLALLVMRRTCLFRAHLHLCRVCSPLVLFRRKLVSFMSHRFFLPRKCQWDLGSGIFCRGVTAGLGQPQPGWLGQSTTWE